LRIKGSDEGATVEHRQGLHHRDSSRAPGDWPDFYVDYSETHPQISRVLC
jgi:hypothetical protein